MKGVVPFILLLAILPACREEGPPRIVVEWQASRTQMERSLALTRAGSPEAARDALDRALRHASAVYRSLDEGVREDTRGYVVPDFMMAATRVAEISLLQGADDPDALVRAIRVAYRATKEAPEHAAPHGVFGAALAEAGCYRRAAESLEKHLELLPPNTPTPAREQLADVLLRYAERVLLVGELGCEAEARKILTRARELTIDLGGHPGVGAALGELNREYSRLANEAGRRGDTLERIRVHTRFGFLDVAKELLDDVVRRSQVVGEIRWVVARYYYEALNNQGALKKAVQVYEDLFKDGSHGEDATAAWVRAQRRLGKIEEALERFGQPESPGESLRVELIRTLFDRSLLRDEADYDNWRLDRSEIDRWLLGEIAPELRAELLVELGFLCLRVQDQDRLERLVSGFRRDRPDDRRVLVLQAGLLDLRAKPVLPEDGKDDVAEDGKDDVAEDGRGKRSTD